MIMCSVQDLGFYNETLFNIDLKTSLQNVDNTQSYETGHPKKADLSTM